MCLFKELLEENFKYNQLLLFAPELFGKINLNSSDYDVHIMIIFKKFLNTKYEIQKMFQTYWERTFVATKCNCAKIKYGRPSWVRLNEV